MESYRAGHLTPVFFGSAYNNFGVKELLDALAAWAPPPRPQPAEPRPIEPTEPKVTGFVFKVQANMDPNHRDRIAFLRLSSGQFRRGMKLTQMGTGKVLSVNSPILFFAREREIVDEAWPGDIIGIPNHGVLRVGDTLTEGETVKIVGIPNFAPEILRRVRLEDPMKSKQLKRALDDLDRLAFRSEEHTSELQSHSDLVCRLLLEKKKKQITSLWTENLKDVCSVKRKLRQHCEVT